MKHKTIDFNKDVLERSVEIPVLVDFWAEWCAPCRILGPVLERLAERFKEQWELVKIDSDKHPDIAAKYGVRGIPNVKLFSGGKVIDEFTGALPENRILDWLKTAIPNKYQKQIDKAKELISTGNEEEAKKILEDVLFNAPLIIEAKVLNAKISFFENPKRSLELITDIDIGTEFYETVESLQTFGRLFELYESPDKLPESNTKQDYLNAIEKLRNKKFDDALTGFINIIRNDRFYDNDGARKACISIFKFLGEENEITLKHRKDFGSALY